MTLWNLCKYIWSAIWRDNQNSKINEMIGMQGSLVACAMICGLSGLVGIYIKITDLQFCECYLTENMYFIKEKR